MQIRLRIDEDRKSYDLSFRCTLNLKYADDPGPKTTLCGTHGLSESSSSRTDSSTAHSVLGIKVYRELGNACHANILRSRPKQIQNSELTRFFSNRLSFYHVNVFARQQVCNHTNQSHHWTLLIARRSRVHHKILYICTHTHVTRIHFLAAGGTQASTLGRVVV